MEEPKTGFGDNAIITSRLAAAISDAYKCARKAQTEAADKAVRALLDTIESQGITAAQALAKEYGAARESISFKVSLQDAIDKLSNPTTTASMLLRVEQEYLKSALLAYLTKLEHVQFKLHGEDKNIIEITVDLTLGLKH